MGETNNKRLCHDSGWWNCIDHWTFNLVILFVIEGNNPAVGWKPKRKCLLI